MIVQFPCRNGVAVQISEVVQDWIADRRADGYRDRGVDSYESVLNHFIAWANNPAVQVVDRAAINRYKRAQAAQGLASGTIRNRLTVLRAFFDWTVREGLRDDNPTDEVTNPKVTAPAPDPLSREQIAALLQACEVRSKPDRGTDARSRRCVYVMLYAGLRIAEAAELRWSDIDLDRGIITVRPEGGKGGKSRLVPMAEELETELRRVRRVRPADAVAGQRNGKKLTVKSLAHIFERWLPARGIHIHAHQLRKTFATELYLSSRDLLLVQRCLGHADPKTTLRYIGGESGLLDRDAVFKLRFKDLPRT
jgi:site-specific recombinase XerD